MKIFTLATLLAVSALAGCSTTSNNANLRGANTNTGYVTNSETNAKPTIPADVTNMSPGNMTNSNSMSNATNGNSMMNRNANSMMNRNATPR